MFGQLITAMITPFTEDNQLDWESVEKILEHLIRTGSDSIVVVGTTGESPTLSVEEKLNLYRFAVQHANGRAKIIAGTGSNHTQQSVELTKEAEKIGVDGALLVVPYYNKPSQAGLYRHFEAISKGTNLPIMLYNIPGRTGINMTVDTMAQLSQLENIVAIKESSGDLDQITQLISVLDNKKTKVYSGDDSLLLPILSVGGTGVVSVASHLVGRQMKEMINSFESGDVRKATTINQQLYPIFKGLFITSNPVPIKYALSQFGLGKPIVRSPLIELNESEKIEVNQWLRKIEF